MLFKPTLYLIIIFFLLFQLTSTLGTKFPFKVTSLDILFDNSYKNVISKLNFKLSPYKEKLYDTALSIYIYKLGILLSKHTLLLIVIFSLLPKMTLVIVFIIDLVIFEDLSLFFTLLPLMLLPMLFNLFLLILKDHSFWWHTYIAVKFFRIIFLPKGRYVLKKRKYNYKCINPKFYWDFLYIRNLTVTIKILLYKTNFYINIFCYIVYLIGFITIYISI